MERFAETECYEIHGTRNENLSVGGNIGYNASVALRTPWSKRAALVDELLLTPRIWPYATGSIKPAAVSCSVTPDQTVYDTDGDGQIINYPWARVEVNYEMTYENIQDNQGAPGTSRQLLSESLEPIIQQNTVPNIGRRHFFDTVKEGVDGRKANDKLSRIDENTPIILPLFTMRLTRTLYNLPSVPQSALSHVGKINAEAYTSNLLNLTFAAETLLFEPSSSSRSISTTGSTGWNVTAKFHYRDESWNKFFNPRNGAFEWIRWRNSAEGFPYLEPYKTADFSDWLF